MEVGQDRCSLVPKTGQLFTIWPPSTPQSMVPIGRVLRRFVEVPALRCALVDCSCFRQRVKAKLEYRIFGQSVPNASISVCYKESVAFKTVTCHPGQNGLWGSKPSFQTCLVNKGGWGGGGGGERESRRRGEGGKRTPSHTHPQHTQTHPQKKKKKKGGGEERETHCNIVSTRCCRTFRSSMTTTRRTWMTRRTSSQPT